jgi:2-iminobutanoate/2-iminopropanoate deaminase
MAREVVAYLNTFDAPPSTERNQWQGDIRQGDGYREAVVFEQAGLHPLTWNVPEGGIGPQTTQAVKNVLTVLGQADVGPGAVYQVDVNLASADLDEFGNFNKAYLASGLIAGLAQGQGVLPTRFTTVAEQTNPRRLVTVSARAAFREQGGGSIIEAIETPGAPAAVAAYSQGVRLTGDAHYMVVTSGQIGLDPHTNKLVAGGLVPEAERVRDSMDDILRAGGAEPSQIVALDVVTPTRGNFGPIRQVLSDWVPQSVSPEYSKGGLLLGASVEMRTRAMVPKSTTTVVDLKAGRPRR